LLKKQLDRGELRPIFLFDKVRTRKVDAEEVKIFDPDGLSFFNMNTPDDYQRALHRWCELHASASQTRDEPVSCTVELFGMAQMLAKTKTVSLALPQDATLSHLFSALAEKLPILVGRVITPEKNSSLVAAPATSTVWNSFAILLPGSRPGIEFSFFPRMRGAEPCMVSTVDCSRSI
jgi:hypothetical protein